MQKVKVLIDNYHWNGIHNKNTILTVGKEITAKRAERDVKRKLLAEVKPRGKKNVSNSK